MKRKISSLLILSLVLGSLTVNASAIRFPDVNSGAWYSEAVEYVSELGVMAGDEEGNFNPDKFVTRAEMATVICQTLEKTLSEEEYLPVYMETENFSDVPVDHWANGYINKVTFLKIISGYGNGRFGPSDYLTYEQAVTMIVKMLGAEAEASARGGYPNGYLETADDMGLLYGVRSAKGENLSRANVAMLLFNCLHDGVNKNLPMDGDNNFPQNDQFDVDIESNPAQDNQFGDYLEIGDSQQEDQPENESAAGGAGGGT